MPRPERSGNTRPDQPKDIYKLLGTFCTSAVSPHINTEMTLEIPISKAPNIQPLYNGDIIAVSGSIDKWLGIQSILFGGYSVSIIVDSFKVIKKSD